MLLMAPLEAVLSRVMKYAPCLTGWASGSAAWVAGSVGYVTGLDRPNLGLLRLPCSRGSFCEELGQANEVVGANREGKGEAHLREPSELSLPLPGRSLDPTEDLLDAFSNLMPSA